MVVVCYNINGITNFVSIVSDILMFEILIHIKFNK